MNQDTFFFIIFFRFLEWVQILTQKSQWEAQEVEQKVISWLCRVNVIYIYRYIKLFIKFISHGVILKAMSIASTLRSFKWKKWNTSREWEKKILRIAPHFPCNDDRNWENANTKMIKLMHPIRKSNSSLLMYIYIYMCRSLVIILVISLNTDI